MFNNLIESSSHRKEFKRRGSFFLFTVGTYLLLFVITGVASIYAYDANLGEQTYEVVITMLPPVDITTAPKPVDPEPPNTPHNGTSTFDVRRNPTATVDTPLLVPKEISTKQNPDLPVRQGVPTVVGGTDSNALLPGNRGVTGNATQVSQPVNIVDDPPPPGPPAPKPPAILKVSRVLNSQALALPRPTYPMMARQIRLQGAVNVQVLIDETGKVISAKAVSGHPLLIVAAQQAAMQARFSPTIVGEQPVKVSGVITYNFVMQ
jgi:TonB family protein